MVDAEQQNSLRRAKKVAQNAAAKAKAVHTKKAKEVEEFDWRYYGVFDNETLISASYYCNEKKYPFVDSRGLKELINQGKVVIKINNDSPNIGGELIKIKKDGYYDLQGKKIQSKIRSISVMINPPICITFIAIKDRRTGNIYMEVF